MDYCKCIEHYRLPTLSQQTIEKLKLIYSAHEIKDNKHYMISDRVIVNAIGIVDISPCTKVFNIASNFIIGMDHNSQLYIFTDYGKFETSIYGFTGCIGVNDLCTINGGMAAQYLVSNTGDIKLIRKGDIAKITYIGYNQYALTSYFLSYDEGDEHINFVDIVDSNLNMIKKDLKIDRAFEKEYNVVSNSFNYGNNITEAILNKPIK